MAGAEVVVELACSGSKSSKLSIGGPAGGRDGFRGTGGPGFRGEDRGVPFELLCAVEADEVARCRDGSAGGTKTPSKPNA